MFRGALPVCKAGVMQLHPCGMARDVPCCHCMEFPRLLLTWTLQGLWVSLTLAPALAAVSSTKPKGIDVLAFVGLAVWVLGFALEATADLQKSRFRAGPSNKGSFITTGLAVRGPDLARLRLPADHPRERRTPVPVPFLGRRQK